jgi:hypothetical protein
MEATEKDILLYPPCVPPLTYQDATDVVVEVADGTGTGTITFQTKRGKITSNLPYVVVERPRQKMVEA